MYVIFDLHDAVFRNAGSYVIMPKSSGLTLIFRRSIALIVSFSIGTTYSLPVRLSRIVRVFSLILFPFLGALDWTVQF